MESYEKLLAGYREFLHHYQKDVQWRSTAKDRQNPDVMIIACSDSRVNPVILTGAGLGEVFIVNNVANLVPPYKDCGNTHHSTSAAIEYAVTQLQVRHIIVMGHSGCGGIRALLADHDETDLASDDHYSFIRPWMKMVDAAADFSAEEKATLDEEQMADICERRASLISLNNLKSFPWVRDALQDGRLRVHAWHFDIASGVLEEYDETTGQFQELL